MAGNSDTTDNSGEGDIHPDISGAAKGNGNNLIGNLDGRIIDTLIATEANSLGNGSDLVSANAKLGKLQNNGGITPTHALLSGSPAIDAGDNNEILQEAFFDINGDGTSTTIDFNGDGDTNDSLFYDQRGEDFDRVIGDTVDIGAFEFGNSVLLNEDDLIWRNNETGENIAWLMDGKTRNGRISLDPISDTDWQLKAVGDFNNDDNKDLVWRNEETGKNSVWLMNGTTKDSSVALDAVPSSDWDIQGVGDFNNDGNTDIVWRDKLTGQNSVWLMNGVEKESRVVLDTVSSSDWDIQGVGDLSKDGNPDLVWRNSKTGNNAVWLMNGIEKESRVTLDIVSSSDWNIQGIGSFNGGTNPDLLWRNNETGENAVWLMDGLEKIDRIALNAVPNSNWTATI